MITNFEEVTADLTLDEKKIIKPLINALKRHTITNPVKEPTIVKVVNNNQHILKFSKKFTGVKLRKMVNFIRSKSLLPVIATQKGYYVSEDQIEIEKQVKSMIERSDRILSAANGMKKFLKK